MYNKVNMGPGFRFYPTEEELVSFYLRKKIEGASEDLNRAIESIIPVHDIYEFIPWDLPHLAGEVCKSDQEQWFFFIPRQESEARGGRPSRVTTSGYWKVTGSPGYVYSYTDNRVVGVKRSMVFYNGRPPIGTKTEWKINEYKAIIREVASSSDSQQCLRPRIRHEFSLCRVYNNKSKFMRAFDRRPLGVNQMTDHQVDAPAQHAHVGHDQQATTSANTEEYQNSIPVAASVEKASHDHEGSSSTYQHAQYSSQMNGESNDMAMVALDHQDQLPLWDLDMLDLLF